MLESTLEVHKNGAYILLTENKNYKNTFPSNKAISDVVAFINTIIVENTIKNEYKKNIDDTINITEIQMSKLIRTVKEKYSKGFSKEYREMPEDKMLTEVVKYMEQFDMLRCDQNNKGYIIMPMCFKIIGKYPQEFINKTAE